tara:strand:- start:4390 stop:4875 length:486 start_codon:yes stop_codon:yes gene_type:complete
MPKGFHIRHTDGVQEWFYEDDFDVLGYVTNTLGLDPLLDVRIDAFGIAVLDINGTGAQHFYYGDDVAQWVIDQGFTNPVIVWQEDWESSPATLTFADADSRRSAALAAMVIARSQITLHEDSDPTATFTEADWRVFRVALRAYINLADGVIVVTNQPAEPS